MFFLRPLPASSQGLDDCSPPPPPYLNVWISTENYIQLLGSTVSRQFTLTQSLNAIKGTEKLLLVLVSVTKISDKAHSFKSSQIRHRILVLLKVEKYFEGSFDSRKHVQPLPPTSPQRD